MTLTTTTAHKWDCSVCGVALRQNSELNSLNMTNMDFGTDGTVICIDCHFNTHRRVNEILDCTYCYDCPERQGSILVK